jgi:superfamily II DNA or RNA helicase
MALNDKYTMREHQLHAVETAVKRNGNIILSHPVGSGKTGSSIAVFEKLKLDGLANRALVVTPASLRTNYGENGVKKFTDSDYRVYGNKQEVSSDQTGLFCEPKSEGPEYGLVSYEMFREDPEKYIKGHNADTVIFDEVHRIKNDESKTFKALKDSRGMFRNFIAMTGSITSNTPADVVPLIDAMTAGNHQLGSKASFENRFVKKDAKGKIEVINPILVRSLIAPYVHNVTEEQLEEGTGIKRPDKYVHEINIPLSGQHEEYYRYVIKQLDPITKAKLSHGLGKLGKAELDQIFSKMLKARQVANSMHMLDTNMTLEESAEKSVKIKRLLDDVEEHLNTVPDAQVVVHSELIQGGLDVLQAGLKKRGIEYGLFIGKGNKGVTEKSRQQDVDDYNAGKKKVLLISAAGGEGLDLPNTTLVASLDGHWNPEKINQVEARGIRMGGLSHRPESERKVIVNRYITKLPVSNIDTMRNTKNLLSPTEFAMRIFKGEKAFFNPHKAMPTVDQLMYAVAKSKAQGNEQLKGLFEKTSAYSFNSDRNILNSYLDRFQDKLLTGDYQDKWIDEAEENRYINRLKRYYASANRKGVVAVTPKDYDKYKDRTRQSQALRNFGMGMGLGAGIGGLYGTAYTTKLLGFKKALKLGAGVGTIAGAITGGVMARNGDKPHVTTTAAIAKKRLKLEDDNLLKILRGEAVKEEQTKVTEHYIKLK